MAEVDQKTRRKGPWTEHEDFQLVFHVHMFGDRRWDFIAHVSGLKRTGKSCRLRWVNYLNPVLKRGKLAPHEERLVLELHSKFGNRWSKIAKKLPGRTDNEIKNYWRTHMRKIAQEKKRATSRSQSPSFSHCSSSSSITITPIAETNERSFYDTIMGGKNKSKPCVTNVVSDSSEVQEPNYSMDEIWNAMELLDDNSGIKPFSDSYREIAPLTGDNCMSTLWTMDGQEEFTKNMFYI